MVDWLTVNLRDRATYEAICVVERGASSELCPACGLTECGSAICEVKRRKAQQQAKTQAWAAAAGVTEDAR